MSSHDDLLNEGPREAPEPETAEERTRSKGIKAAGGGVAAGGIGLAKAGILGKVFIWLFLWNGISTAGRIGGWVGIALVVALIAGFLLYRRHKETAR